MQSIVSVSTWAIKSVYSIVAFRFNLLLIGKGVCWIDFLIYYTVFATSLLQTCYNGKGLFSVYLIYFQLFRWNATKCYGSVNKKNVKSLTRPAWSLHLLGVGISLACALNNKGANKAPLLLTLTGSYYQ